MEEKRLEQAVGAAVPAIETLRASIIMKRSQVVHLIADMKRMKEQHGLGSYHLSSIQSTLLSLYLEIRPLLRRRLPKEVFEELRVDIQTGEYEALLNSFFIIDDFLDEIELLKIDVSETSRRPWVEQRGGK